MLMHQTNHLLIYKRNNISAVFLKESQFTLTCTEWAWRDSGPKVSPRLLQMLTLAFSCHHLFSTSTSASIIHSGLQKTLQGILLPYHSKSYFELSSQSRCLGRLENQSKAHPPSKWQSQWDTREERACCYKDQWVSAAGQNIKLILLGKKKLEGKKQD